jgi:hypothetical protein
MTIHGYHALTMVKKDGIATEKIIACIHYYPLRSGNHRRTQGHRNICTAMWLTWFTIDVAT